MFSHLVPLLVGTGVEPKVVCNLVVLGVNELPISKSRLLKVSYYSVFRFAFGRLLIPRGVAPLSLMRACWKGCCWIARGLHACEFGESRGGEWKFGNLIARFGFSSYLVLM